MSEVDLESSSMRAGRGARAVLRGIGGWLEHGVDRRPVRAFAVLTVFYVGVVAALSSVKLLWLDELITLHIARLGSFGAIWNALAQGADPKPQITRVLVHY